MKSSKIILIIVIGTVMMVGAICGIITINKNKKVQKIENEQTYFEPVKSTTPKATNNNIPDGYIAVFHGGVGEQTHETYIYKEDNGHANYGFDYINTTSTTKSWGSSEWNVKVTKQGSVMWTDDVFTVAEKNNAYSYVTLPNDIRTYSIEDFMGMFLMN